MIACENLTRKARLMELDEKYAQVIIQRWCDYTQIDSIKINGIEVSWNDYKNSVG
jgi:DNA modification methylase